MWHLAGILDSSIPGFLQVCCILQVGQGGPGEREGQEPRGDGDRGQSQGRGRQGTGKLVS